jgi:hypothetical protein
VRITSVVELEAPIPGEAMIPGATAAAVGRHRWLVPAVASDDGLLHLSIQLVLIESQG